MEVECIRGLKGELTVGRVYTRIEDTEGHYEAMGNLIVINDRDEIRAYTKYIFQKLD